MGHWVTNSDEYDVKMQIFGENVQAKEEETSGVGREKRRSRGGGDEVSSGPRGTKRKLEDMEEEEAEKVDDGGGGGGGCFSGTYLVERQSVFNVFMCKLHRYRQVADPSLRRSVLICNTLRSIEREMVNEGMEPDSMGSSSVPFVPSVETDNMTLDDPLPSSSPSSPESPPTYAAMLPLEPRSGFHCEPYERKDPPRFGSTDSSFIESDGSDDSSETERSLSPPSTSSDDCHEERLPGINWSSVLNFSNESDVDCVVVRATSGDAWNFEDGGRHQDGASDSGGGPNTSPSSSSDSGISTASDEIFGDIDLSLYDFDLLPLSPPNARVVPPPSIEELLRSFPGEQTMVLPPNSAVQQQQSASRADQTERARRVKTNAASSD